MTLKEIKLEVDERAKALSVAEIGLPTYGYSEGWTARPYSRGNPPHSSPCLGFHPGKAHNVPSRSERSRSLVGLQLPQTCHSFLNGALIVMFSEVPREIVQSQADIKVIDKHHSRPCQERKGGHPSFLCWKQREMLELKA